ncbi:MAG: succinate dehydrogenase cytochrome b subunit [Chthoniobacterales bacterium]
MSAGSATTAPIPIFKLFHQWIFSSIGKKTIVALTGLLLVLFLLGHMLGNLSIFLGPNALNTYAAKLQSLGALLWVIRLGLLAVFGAHIYFTVLLILENQAATPTKYQAANHVKATVFAKTMRYTGPIIFLFVLFHLAHFTLGYVQPEVFHLMDAEGRHDVYSIVILGFQNVPISLFYIISLILMTCHLNHGIGSLFQTFGINNRATRELLNRAGEIFSWIICLGFISIPIAVLLGILHPLTALPF